MKSKGSDDIQQLMLYEVMGHATPEESQALQEMLQQDPGLREKFEDLKRRYNPDNAANPLQRVAPEWAPAEELMDKARESTDKGHRSSGWLWAAAAAIIACIAGGYYFFNSQSDDTLPGAIVRTDASKAQPLSGVMLTTAGGEAFSLSSDSNNRNISLQDISISNTNKTLTYTIEDNKGPSDIPTAMNRLTVPVGLTYQVALSDGTEISLNSGTTLDFPFRFNENLREVTINGEAFFKVAKNVQKPFIVHTPFSTVQVLGTSFNVNSYDSGIVKVALVEGSVMFQGTGKQTMLKPGKQAISNHAKGTVKVMDFDQDLVLSWRSGKYIFQNASLEEISSVLTRWYGVRVELDKGARILNDSFDGELDRGKPIEKFLEDLKFATGLNYSFDAKGMLHLQ